MEQLIINYTHCDVFTNHQMSGNSLTVFFLDKHPEQYNNKFLLSITREMRHFESVFVNLPGELSKDKNLLTYSNEGIPLIIVPARIFACSRELDFAGHPLLGAAGSIHNTYFSDFTKIQVQFNLNNNRSIIVKVDKSDYGYQATMSQGKPEFLGTLNNVEQQRQLLGALSLTSDTYDAEYPMEIISTGLRYLIIPVKNNDILNQARIIDANFGKLLAKYNADFVYVVDLKNKTARTWENDGSSEDAATGSAAGPLGAYMVKHGIVGANEIFEINQGEFIGRKSKLIVQVINNFENILVTGGVCMVGNGCIKLHTLFIRKLESM